MVSLLKTGTGTRAAVKRVPVPGRSRWARRCRCPSGACRRCRRDGRVAGQGAASGTRRPFSRAPPHSPSAAAGRRARRGGTAQRGKSGTRAGRGSLSRKLSTISLHYLRVCTPASIRRFFICRLPCLGLWSLCRLWKNRASALRLALCGFARPLIPDSGKFAGFGLALNN